MSIKKPLLLTPKNIFSIYYHNIFGHPLSLFELIKWEPGERLKNFDVDRIKYEYKNGYFYLKGQKGLVYARTLGKRISIRKLKIARKAANILGKISTVKAVVLTGSLAMLNAKTSSDIDLMIITQRASLWISRLLSLLLLKASGIPVRRFGDENEKDKICINMWFDETSVVWSKNDRNFYTAHEIVQIIPLVNKEKSYEKFLYKNRWVKAFWPNAVKIVKQKRIRSKKESLLIFFMKLFEPLAYKFQTWYMRKKKTREVVSKRRAIFHPIDRSADVKRVLELIVK